MDTTTAHGKMLFTILSGISQFERDLISEGTKERIIATRKRGKVPGRPKVEYEKFNMVFFMKMEQLKR
ncbi:recombinase family protein [Bacillus velezensis]|nr:recombinase family protein [Bacillus velezensis]MEC1338597.1 recombinase family protein [Bacillus velezensis]